jgi:FkbH-like protein
MLAELNDKPSLVNLTRVARELLPQKSSLAGVSARIACVSTFTFEPVAKSIELQSLRAGAAIETFVTPFGQFDQQLIDRASALHAFKPQIVLAAVRLADGCPELYDSFNSLSAQRVTQLVDDWIARLRSALNAFRQHSATPILLHNYEMPIEPALGMADGTSANSHCSAIHRANELLAAMAKEIPNIFVMDYDALVARHGRQSWTDPRLLLVGRMPVAQDKLWALAGFYVRHMRPLLGISKKVLVVDADNTLWGGVAGDVGVEGIALGPDYPGNAFVLFQKRLLDLYQRGVVLCIASRNEQATVDEILDRHPAMVLKRNHFAAMRVNWQPKPDNLRSIAAELNLGLDSFVFIDDSDVECALMRASLPEVLAIRLPAEPAEYARAIDDLDVFDQWTISEEDRKRGELYHAEAKRRELRDVAVDLPTFYRQLEMKLTIRVDDSMQVARAAQMAARTNQFNMHTIRCTEADMQGFVKAGDHHLITLSLTDRFGDHGVVGLAVTRTVGDECVLHMLLMSCRILGRTVEQGFIKWIGGHAKKSRAARLVGLFAPTAKNKPFADFFPSCGFEADPSSVAGDGPVQRWTWRLEQADLTVPDWLAIVEEKAR